MAKLNIWHTLEEIKDFKGSCIYIFTDTRHIYEATYCGGGECGEPLFTVNGLTIDNSQIKLWCDRLDIVKKTNLMDKIYERDR